MQSWDRCDFHGEAATVPYPGVCGNIQSYCKASRLKIRTTCRSFTSTPAIFPCRDLFLKNIPVLTRVLPLPASRTSSSAIALHGAGANWFYTKKHRCYMMCNSVSRRFPESDTRAAAGPVTWRTSIPNCGLFWAAHHRSARKSLLHLDGWQQFSVRALMDQPARDCGLSCLCWDFCAGIIYNTDSGSAINKPGVPLLNHAATN